ncbi:MAG: hypothetical protein ACR2MG_15270 [Pyrinomonadaceae bacterium]
MNIKKYSKVIFSVSQKVILIIFCGLYLSSQIYAQPGRLDLNFQNVLAPGAEVRTIETQPDGKILVAGKVTTRGTVSRREVARLNADGSLDPTFNIVSTSGGSEFGIFFIKLQADGKILVGGNFNNINGIFRSAIARLNTDGSVDTTFELSGINITFIHDLDLQTDGKILVSASNLGGSSFVTRLRTDGTNDPGFGQVLTYTRSDAKVAFLPTENKILLGDYTPGFDQRSLKRLNLDGTIDTTFSVANVTTSTSNLYIRPLANGKILLWGRFDTVNQTTRRNIAILNNDGSLDTSFNPATGGTGTILSVAVQTNGKIIIGGNTFTSNTFVRGNVARLNADGSVDTTFNQGRGANADVRALKIRNNNKLLIGGTFFRYHTFPRSGLAQINL